MVHDAPRFGRVVRMTRAVAVCAARQGVFVEEVMEYKTRSYARSKTQIENEKGCFSIWIFRIRKKSYLILRKAIYIFLIKKSRSKNAVFRFRSAFSISHKIGPKPAHLLGKIGTKGVNSIPSS